MPPRPEFSVQDSLYMHKFDGSMTGWQDGSMDEWLAGLIERSCDGRMAGLMAGQTDGWLDGSSDRAIVRLDGWMDVVE